jgi:hypothetical protein
MAFWSEPGNRPRRKRFKYPMQQLGRTVFRVMKKAESLHKEWQVKSWGLHIEAHRVEPMLRRRLRSTRGSYNGLRSWKISLRIS